MSQPGAEPTQQALTLSQEDADKIKTELSSITFEIEKKLSVPNNSGGNEEAYMAEDKNKVATYNLVIKIDKTPIQAGTEPTETQKFLENIKKALVDMNTYEFSLSNIELAYLPITYNYMINNTETKETIHVYHIKSAKILPIKRVSIETYNVENIFAIQATRQKTNVREQAAIGIFTPQQQQELIPLEDTIMAALKELVGGYGNTGFVDINIESQLNKLKPTWNTVGITFKQETLGRAKEAIFALFDAFKLPDTLTIDTINEDPLVKNLNRYKEIISKVGGSTAFKLNFTDGKYRPDYLIIKDLIYNINGALIQSKIGSFVDSMIETEQESTKKEKYQKLRAYIPAINAAFATEGGGAIAFTKTGYGLKRLFAKPTTWFGMNKVQLNPAFNKQPTPIVQIQAPAAPAPGQPPGQPHSGGSIKYQQKRYKVRVRDDGAKYITLDKMNYTLKTSSKGTYITRDGKRQYL